MPKHRKRRPKKPPAPPPEPTGIARLLSETPVATLDLHGHTAAQARPRFRNFLATHARISAGRVVHVITGRGNRSQGEAVLLGLVRDMLDDEVAEHVADRAGLVGGGGWVVRVSGG